MPKEVVHGSRDDAFQVIVGWNRDLDVQVGIGSYDDRHLVDRVYADEQALIGQKIIDWIDDLERHKAPDFPTSDAEHEYYSTVGREVLDIITSTTPFGTSVWVNPDRNGINRLIRLLRKARDQAFGADA